MNAVGSTPIWRPTVDAVTDLVASLVRINSVNPGLVDGAPGEGELAHFVAEWLKHAGVEATLREVLPGRPNVYAVVPAQARSAPVLMLNVHLDTVGVEAMPHGLHPQVSDGRLIGRGAADTKGSLAAALLAAARLASVGGGAMQVTIAAVVDEECASAGSEAAAADLRVDHVVVLEPNNLELCVSHLGYAWLTVEVEGRAAHGSRPDEGVDAIARMGPVIQGLSRLQAVLQQRPAHPNLGHGSVHASLITGGQELSSYPARCSLQVERRTLPGETPADVIAEIEQLASHVDAAPGLPAPRIRLDLWRDPLEASEDSSLVEALKAAGTAVLGDRLACRPQRGWTDAAIFAATGKPAAVFGPVGGDFHGANEWVDLASVADTAAVLCQTALEFACDRP